MSSRPASREALTTDLTTQVVQLPMRLGYVVAVAAGREVALGGEFAEIERSTAIEVTRFNVVALGGQRAVDRSSPEPAPISRPSVASGARALGRWLRHRPIVLLRAGWTLRFRWKHSMRSTMRSLVTAAMHADVVLRDGIEHIHADGLEASASEAWVISRLADLSYSVAATSAEIARLPSSKFHVVREARFVVTENDEASDALFRRCNKIVAPILAFPPGAAPGNDRLTRQFLRCQSPVRRSSALRRPAFVAWSRSERAPELAAATGASSCVVYIKRLSRSAFFPIRYALSAVATSWFLITERPKVVVATNPPIIPALIVLAFRRVLGVDLVLDSHPRGFGRASSRAGALLSPLHHYLMRRARATLVASRELAEDVRQHGGTPLIVHEAPPQWQVEAPPAPSEPVTVLWVAIFAEDEPVAEVLDAARRLPDVHFMITGDVNRCPPRARATAPENVEFTGYWPAEAYRRLIERAQIMLVLTTERTSVPRAAFEAVEALRPLVLSDMDPLRSLFEDAVFCVNDGESIAEGVRQAIEQHSTLVEATARARQRQQQRWQHQCDLLLRLLYDHA
jgi:glycosyltransferase involved in cell wall biosynthesis